MRTDTHKGRHTPETDIWTQTQSHTQTHRHIESHTQTHTCIDTQRHAHTHTETHTQSHTHRVTHTDTHTQTHRHTESHTHTQRHTETRTQTRTGSGGAARPTVAALARVLCGQTSSASSLLRTWALVGAGVILKYRHLYFRHSIRKKPSFWFFLFPKPRLQR